ncbi:uncharacterized protein LOC101237669 [Hydra vulgaris]|uniref:uncharacterized protein LOC101237669 n=1 Tax=Hydra vulgaris TaxID=6087 RepID=UPI001F5EA1D7|nr:uncharacterized protein LOC101237669 [Hydra vulgaris]
MARNKKYDLLNCQLALCNTLLDLRTLQSKKKRKHKFWIRFLFKNRYEKGAFNTLIPELRLHDREFFYRFYRMSPERYEHLLSMVAPSITKKPCRSRQTLSPSERLTVTLRYLATGDSQLTQAFYFRLGRTTVCNINETTKAIWDVLKPCYLKAPSILNEWEELENQFENEWNFPNCIRAIDGSYGRDNDASIFNESKMGKVFKNNLFKLPKNRMLSNGTQVPPVLLGDDIFALKSWLMKPFSGKNLTIKEHIFNYRLSRTRRTIKTHLELWINDGINYVPSGFIDFETNSGKVIPGDWCKITVEGNALHILPRCISNRYTTDANTVRLTLTEYFNHLSGSLSWQHDYVTSCGHDLAGNRIFFEQ